MDQACFAAYAQIVQQAFGIQLPPEKKALLESRLFKLFQHEDERLPASCRTATGFLTWLRKDTTGRARKLLSEAITTHHTYFLREEDHFWYFRDVVLPWIAQAAAGRGGATAEHRLSPVQPLDARVPIPKALSCDLLPERHDLLRLGDAHRARTQILRLARAGRLSLRRACGDRRPRDGALPLRAALRLPEARGRGAHRCAGRRSCPPCRGARGSAGLPGDADAPGRRPAAVYGRPAKRSARTDHAKREDAFHPLDRHGRVDGRDRGARGGAHAARPAAAAHRHRAAHPAGIAV